MNIRRFVSIILISCYSLFLCKSMISMYVKPSEFMSPVYESEILIYNMSNEMIQNIDLYVVGADTHYIFESKYNIATQIITFKINFLEETSFLLTGLINDNEIEPYEFTAATFTITDVPHNYRFKLMRKDNHFILRPFN